MEIVNFSLDIVLLIVGLWMIVVVRSSGLGGMMGRAFNAIVVGAAILGLAHLVETLMFEFLGLNADLNETIHRIFILAGFIAMIFGFQALSSLKSLRG